MPINRARVARDITLTSDLNYYVVIEYFDVADSSTVLWAEPFTIPIGATTGQLQTIVVAKGQEVRNAQAAMASARTAVPNGTVVTIP